jgi:hypothetical protein
MANCGRAIDLLSAEANETQHDAVLDYYGRRLATCSSDKTIKIFEVEGEKHTLVETLRGYATTRQCVYSDVDSVLGMKVLYGASRGRTPSTATSSHPRHMTARSSSGANSPTPGKRSTRSPYIPPLSTLSPGHPTKLVACSLAPPRMAMSRFSNSRTMHGLIRSSRLVVAA